MAYVAKVLYLGLATNSIMQTIKNTCAKFSTYSEKEDDSKGNSSIDYLPIPILLSFLSKIIVLPSKNFRPSKFSDSFLIITLQ